MSKGFTLIEMVITIVLLTVLGAFTFSVIWQYSRIYADTRGGYVYGEAAAVLERMSRELRDAGSVDPLVGNPATYINFSLTHGTPATGTGAYWVQYCSCTYARRTILYRVKNTSQGAGNYCQSGCPAGADASLMSRNLVYPYPINPSDSPFQVSYFQGNPTPDNDSYGIRLTLASDGSTNNPSITLVTRVSPRNYNLALTGKSFRGNYYDQSN